MVANPLQEWASYFEPSRDRIRRPAAFGFDTDAGDL